MTRLSKASNVRSAGDANCLVFALFHLVMAPPLEGSVSISAAMLLATYKVVLVASVGLNTAFCGWLTVEFSVVWVALLNAICAEELIPERNRYSVSSLCDAPEGTKFTWITPLRVPGRVGLKLTTKVQSKPAASATPLWQVPVPASVNAGLGASSGVYV